MSQPLWQRGGFFNSKTGFAGVIEFRDVVCFHRVLRDGAGIDDELT